MSPSGAYRHHSNEGEPEPARSATSRISPQKGQEPVIAPDFRGYIDARMAAREIGTYGEVADLADVSRDTLQRWFRGEGAPSPRAAQKVARVLGIGYGELLAAYEGRVTKKDAPPEGEASIAAGLRQIAEALQNSNRLIAALADVQAEQSDRIEQNSARIQTLGEALAKHSAQGHPTTTETPALGETTE